MNELHKYQLRVLGEHFAISIADSEASEADSLIRGFVTTRWVEAASPLHASMQAFALVREQLGHCHRLQENFVPAATLAIVGVWEVETLEPYPTPGPGFTFFSNTSTTLLERARAHLRELWYRFRPQNRPWTYSEPFYQSSRRPHQAAPRIAA
jgi:hypothetical protein